MSDTWSLSRMVNHSCRVLTVVSVSIRSLLGALNRKAWPILAIAHILALNGCTPASNPAVESALSSRYLREIGSNRVVVVFVHGLGGDAKDTWTHRASGAYWPNLLLGDDAFSNVNVYVYQYPSDHFEQTYSIDELADNLRLILEHDGVFEKHDQVVFLAHSMGGLVVRSSLLKYRKLAEKVSMIYFFATPTAGSPLATLAHLLSTNPVLGKLLPLRSDDFLADLQRRWLAAELPIWSYCAYERKPVYGMMVVDQTSATALCNKRLDPIDENHFDIVKPSGVRDIRYMAFKNAFLESRLIGAAHAGPILRVASALEPDEEHRIFRLPVWNDGDRWGIADASLAWLRGGEQPHDKLMPLSLGWMHDKAYLSSKEQGKIEVVWIDRQRDVLILGRRGVYFRHLKIHAPNGDIIGASFCVRVTFLGTDVSQERAFRLIPDKSASLVYRAELVAPSCS